MQSRPDIIRRPSLFGYAWASPATLIGLVFALPAWLAGARMTVVDGVLEVSGKPIGRVIAWLPAPLRFNAMALGHIVIGIDQATLAECRVHERVHVRQYENWGPLFFPLYVASSVWQLLRGRDPYWYNHFERQAYREETRRGRRLRKRAQ